MWKKIISGLLLTLLLLSGVVYPLKTKALFGVVDIAVVSDPAHTVINVLGWLKDVGKWILDHALKVALTTLKKRLLDSLVDETIEWIQGGGDPKFVENPKEFFEDALQAAAGDTAIALGQANLCYEPLKFNLRLKLITPVFSERVRCTLDDIVENVQAFRDDFRKGSWIAYQESLKPQNNRAGIQLLVQSELLNKQSGNKEMAQYQATVAGGYLDQKRCNQWRSDPTESVLDWNISSSEVVDAIVNNCYDEDVSGGNKFILTCSESVYYFSSPDANLDPDREADEFKQIMNYSGKTDRPAGSNFKCTQPKTITPGQVLGESVATAVGSDIEFLIGSQDLTAYVAAIADALINRLAKMGSEGLSYITRSGETRSCTDFTDPLLRSACEDYESSKVSVSEHGEEALEELGEESLDAKVSLAITKLNEADRKNDDLISTLTDLVTCQEGLLEPIDPDAASTLAEAETQSISIDDLLVEAEGLRDDGMLSESRAEAIFTVASIMVTTVEELLGQAETDLHQCQEQET